MTDAQRWQALKAGDKKALEQIYKDHADTLLRYGYRFSADEQLVEDCLQELFIELWRNREGLGENDAILRYLYVAFRRKIIRTVKRSQKETSEELNPDIFEATLAIDAHIIEAEISSEKSALLKKAISQLSSRQQEVLYLKYFRDMDYKDIAEVMDINYQSVRNLCFNAIKAMRKILSTWFWLLCLEILRQL